MNVYEIDMKQINGVNGCHTSVGNTTVEIDAYLFHPGYEREKVHYIVHGIDNSNGKAANYADRYIEYINCGYANTKLYTAKVYPDAKTQGGNVNAEKI